MEWGLWRSFKGDNFCGCGMRMMMMMMMVRGGDLNLNCSPQSFEDSIWEGLKQAMLQHELIFRDQVGFSANFM